VQWSIRYENGQRHRYSEGSETALATVLLDPQCSSETVNRSYRRAVMKNQLDISTIVDAVYETVFYLTGDAHEARWDAYWTLTTLMYPEMEQAA